MNTRYSVAALKALGYRCRREYVTGQGWLGGDGIRCYRVRDRHGKLAMHGISTYQTARQAWEEAAYCVEIRTEHLAEMEDL